MEQNLSPPALADLIRASLDKNQYIDYIKFIIFFYGQKTILYKFKNAMFFFERKVTYSKNRMLHLEMR